MTAFGVNNIKQKKNHLKCVKKKDISIKGREAYKVERR
jgi:hypothetical protein